MQRIARLSRKNERRVQMLPIHLIDVNPYQPRSEFDDEAVRALASSIASLGLLQPITVRPETNGRYTLIAGERRLRACLRLGMQTIEAMLIDAGDGEAAMLALVENLQREDLHFLDEAAAYARVMRLCGFSQEALATFGGKRAAGLQSAALVDFQDFHGRRARCGGFSAPSGSHRARRPSGISARR